MKRLIGVLCHTKSQMLAELFTPKISNTSLTFSTYLAERCVKASGGCSPEYTATLHLHHDLAVEGQVEWSPLAWDRKTDNALEIVAGVWPRCWIITVE